MSERDVCISYVYVNSSVSFFEFGNKEGAQDVSLSDVFERLKKNRAVGLILILCLHFDFSKRRCFNSDGFGRLYYAYFEYQIEDGRMWF